MYYSCRFNWIVFVRDRWVCEVNLVKGWSVWLNGYIENEDIDRSVIENRKDVIYIKVVIKFGLLFWIFCWDFFNENFCFWFKLLGLSVGVFCNGL